VWTSGRRQGAVAAWSLRALASVAPTDASLLRRAGPLEEWALFDKLGMTRTTFENWLQLGTVSRLMRLAERELCPRTVRRRILDMRLEVRPRRQQALAARARDLGSIYEVFERGEYDFSVIPWNRIETILDCGANIGAFSLWALARCRGRAFAVEPSPLTFEVLKQNADRHPGRFEPFCAALGPQSGRRTFYESRYSANSSLLPWRLGWDSDLERYDVETMTLGGLIRQSSFDRVDLLKMDVEGVEQEVVLSLPDTLFRRIGMLIVECHTSLGVHAGTVAQRLAEAGYSVAVETGRESPLILAWR
jgi:FkbM family methyltransferase